MAKKMILIYLIMIYCNILSLANNHVMDAGDSTP
jgi:hypothetical protein